MLKTAWSLVRDGRIFREHGIYIDISNGVCARKSTFMYVCVFQCQCQCVTFIASVPPSQSGSLQRVDNESAGGLQSGAQKVGREREREREIQNPHHIPTNTVAFAR